ncbi:CaiB/BaiF CoA-transferase family protein [Rhodococcus sp. T2V]|uniref:CaiB/BaiF CoA transferase family protein n=1 Tax=Rhodococcus sp. T2V TaxID=3034164 RepID=UPI0023E2DDE3|nr:CaiB/BaiF CoA-transferase family protein [Rhodococcus sp. T2V]MDF3312078.1 CaiB/BaiF CoA-transferase family protein [Rhodococcus sp. T2V]
MTATTGPLAGVRVLDMTRLAPGPYASMLLADLGADVIAIGGGRSGLPVPALARGKEFISLDLKTEDGRQALRTLVSEADVFMEGFRPGVADRLGAGYAELSALNPGLVYCSVTGYGQDGPMAHRAGHDINYLAIGGALGTFGPSDQPPVPPLNLVADFAGGGLLSAFGILGALYDRTRTGKGRYIDSAMVDGVLSMMGMNFVDWQTPTLPGRGRGVLVGSMPFYRCYRCSDGRYVAVGALEVAFFERLWTTLDLGAVPNHFDESTWDLIEKSLTAEFEKKTMVEWTAVFADVDACVTPVLEPHELSTFDQIVARDPGFALDSVPVVPVFCGGPKRRVTDTRVKTEEVLRRAGLPEDVAGRAAADGVPPSVTGLSWPPL